MYYNRYGSRYNIAIYISIQMLSRRSVIIFLQCTLLCMFILWLHRHKFFVAESKDVMNFVLEIFIGSAMLSDGSRSCAQRSNRRLPNGGGGGEGRDEVIGSITMRRGLRYYPRLPEKYSCTRFSSQDLLSFELTLFARDRNIFTLFVNSVIISLPTLLSPFRYLTN